MACILNVYRISSTAGFRLISVDIRNFIFSLFFVRCCVVFFQYFLGAPAFDEFFRFLDLKNVHEFCEFVMLGDGLEN